MVVGAEREWLTLRSTRDGCTVLRSESGPLGPLAGLELALAEASRSREADLSEPYVHITMLAR